MKFSVYSAYFGEKDTLYVYRGRERELGGEKDRERKRERVCVCLCYVERKNVFVYV